MSVRTWCQENGLSEKTYYYWQRRMFCLLSDQQPTFTEVQVHRVFPGDIAVTVRIGEVAADIHNGADKVTIEQVLSVLKSC